MKYEVRVTKFEHMKRKGELMVVGTFKIDPKRYKCFWKKDVDVLYKQIQFAFHDVIQEVVAYEKTHS